MKSEEPSARSYKFPKSQRLHSKVLIDRLFRRGHSFFIHPFRTLHLQEKTGAIQNHQVLITVSSKKFKRAVDRNLIKRRIREAYRQNKYMLEDGIDPQTKLLIGYIYTGKDVPTYDLVETKLKLCLKRLKSEY